jgi:Tfp pilus assembly protein PilF
MAENALAQSDTSSGEWSLSQPFGNWFSKPSPPAHAPAPTPANDPISLQNPGKAGVELHVAVANLYVESKKYAEAEEQYRIAMKKAPGDVRVLLGYAMLKDKMGRPEEAWEFYQQAEKKYPQNAAVYNNLAIHFIRRDMLREAVAAAQRAVDLRPQEARYRNNLAVLLVEAGLPHEAFKQLRAVYDEPIAHYNLGFLLNKRGMKGPAMQEFTIALQQSPRMALARQWVERLSRERGEASAGAAAAPPIELQAAPLMPANPAPRHYVAPPQYPAPVPGPVQAQNPAVPPGPPRIAPQNAAAPPVSPPAVVPAAPAVASRDLQAGVRVLPPPAPNSAEVRRLPPVNDARGAVELRPLSPPAPEQVAPNPPAWRR